MELTDNLEDLQKWANYRWLRKTLRGGGIGSIIFGALAMVAGASGVGKDLLDTVMFSIGTFLLLEGLWIVKAPTPAGIVVDGIALLTLGAFNIGSTILEAKGSGWGHGGRGFVMLGIWQIIWGLQSFSRYKVFASLPMGKPSAAKLRRLDSLGRSVSTTGTASASDVIAYAIKAEKKQLSVEALLLQDMAVIASDGGKRLMFLRKGDFDIAAEGPSGAGDFHNISVRADNMAGTGLISSESLSRYDTWKRGLFAEEQVIPKLADRIGSDVEEYNAPAMTIDLASVKLAGFWRRFAANLLDTLVLAAGILAVWLIVAFIMFAALPEDVHDLPPKLDAALSHIMWASVVIVPWLYFAFMESSPKQTSLGKLAMKMAVTDHEGKRISFWRASGRHWGKLVSGLLLCIGYVMAAFTEKKQALHDLMAGTLIVNVMSDK